MGTDKHGLNTEMRDCVFSLSANGVGGEGRGEVARKDQNPSPCPSPRLGGARGKRTYSTVVFYPCPSVFIRG